MREYEDLLGPLEERIINDARRLIKTIYMPCLGDSYCNEYAQFISAEEWEARAQADASDLEMAVHDYDIWMTMERNQKLGRSWPIYLYQEN